MRIALMPLLTAFVASIITAPLSAGAAEEREADHQALRALRDKAALAINKEDIKTLATCFADEFAFTTLDQTVLTNESQLAAFYDRMFHGSSAIVESMKIEPKAEVLTRFVSDNAGYCYGTSLETYKLKNGNVSIWVNRWTALVVKQNGEWKVAAVHAGANFLDNPLLSRLKTFSKYLAAGTGVGGLVAGALAGLLLGRRKN